MTERKAFTTTNLATLTGIIIKVSPYVQDHHIVLKAKRRNDPLHIMFNLSVWDLKTGELHGNLAFADATELHCSQKRYGDICRVIAQAEARTA